MFVDSLTEFILFIAPGFIAVEVYRSVYPSKERNTFPQIAYSIISGLIVFSGVNHLSELFFPNVVNSGNGGFPDTRYIFLLLFGGLLLGLLVIGLTELRYWLGKKVSYLKWIIPGAHSVWELINSSFQEWAIVYVDDGTIYLGWISEYQNDPNRQDQDFLLAGAKVVNEDLEEKYIVNGQGVYLNTRNIIRIEFYEGE